MESLPNKKDELQQKWETQTQSAITAIDSVKKQDIQMCKSLANPPEAVKDVVALVAIVLDHVKVKNGKKKDPDWADCQKMMNVPPTLVAKLKELDFAAIPPEKIKDLQKYMANHPQEYTVENIKKKSSACAGMIDYVNNLIDASDTYSQLEEMNK